MKTNTMLLSALAAAFVFFVWSRSRERAGMIAKTADNIRRIARGIRNHNPGNIERTAARWQGMAADQSSDPRFVVFTEPVWGIRALARVLRSYMQLGFITPRQIINRWAPPHENITSAYVQSVAKHTGLGPDDPVGVHNLPELVTAIIQHENGVQPYHRSVIEEALRLESNAVL